MCLLCVWCVGIIEFFWIGKHPLSGPVWGLFWLGPRTIEAVNKGFEKRALKTINEVRLKFGLTHLGDLETSV